MSNIFLLDDTPPLIDCLDLHFFGLAKNAFEKRGYKKARINRALTNGLK